MTWTGSLQRELLARVNESPDRRALTFYRENHPIGWLSRAQVLRRGANAAAWLRDCGLHQGEVCAIVLPSDEQAAMFLLGVLLAGGIPLLIAPPRVAGSNRAAIDTIAQTLRRARARLALCSPLLDGDLPNIRRVAAGTRLIAPPQAPWTATDVPFSPVVPSPTSVAAMQLTSGTTTSPRICVWDHGALGASIVGMTAAMGLSREDVCFNWTPLYHDMGLVNNFLLCLAMGVPLVLLNPHEFIRRPALWLRGLSDTGATTTWSPNFGFAVATSKVDDRDLQGVRLEHVDAFWNAAERIRLETMQDFHERFAPWGVRAAALKTNYGCAENVGGATFSDRHEPPIREWVDASLFHDRGIARPLAPDGCGAKALPIVSAGRPHPGVQISIVSRRATTPLADGIVGEICLASKSCMLRYQRNARETRRALRGGLLRTGDLGYLRDGELFWVGRIREQINIHGKKLDPSIFVPALSSIKGLREGCLVAFGIPERHRGTERLVIVSEVRLPPADDLHTITAAIKRSCFHYVGISPDDVVLVPPGTLSKTSSGKSRHRFFRKQYLADGLESVRLTNASLLAHA